MKHTVPQFGIFIILLVMSIDMMKERAYKCRAWSLLYGMRLRSPDHSNPELAISLYMVLERKSIPIVVTQIDKQTDRCQHTRLIYTHLIRIIKLSSKCADHRLLPLKIGRRVGRG